MKIGIIGLARSGKTTLFNALSGAHAAVGAFGSREANIAVIKVPDARVDQLAALVKPKKTTYAEVQFIDVAPNESMGEKKVLDNAALTHLKNTDALVHVVRAFRNEDVMHPSESVDPVRDSRMLEEELQLTDLIVIEKRVERLEKEHKKGSEHDLLVRCRAHIETGASLRTLELDTQESRELGGFCFLLRRGVHRRTGSVGTASVCGGAAPDAD
ncbi:MAG: 50S ribosome-binding GTPase [Candidatus Hydrogenedentes bacterium]|nr:50S ribosome-binding GTPase [Candidatus Hydrogenedentota bacterium]